MRRQEKWRNGQINAALNGAPRALERFPPLSRPLPSDRISRRPSVRRESALTPRRVSRADYERTRVIAAARWLSRLPPGALVLGGNAPARHYKRTGKPSRRASPAQSCDASWIPICERATVHPAHGYGWSERDREASAEFAGDQFRKRQHHPRAIDLVDKKATLVSSTAIPW